MLLRDQNWEISYSVFPAALVISTMTFLNYSQVANAVPFVTSLNLLITEYIWSFKNSSNGTTVLAVAEKLF